MKRICWRYPVLLIFSVFWVFSMGGITTSKAQSPECPPGFHWDRLSGVGCVQTNCLDIANAKYTYTGTCSCIEGYKGCFDPVDSSGVACYPFCPTSKLEACILPDASCPGADPLPGGQKPEDFLDESPTDPEIQKDPALTAVSNADLVRFLETILVGENAQTPSPGWGVLSSLVAAMLLGIWILINALPNLSLDDIRSLVGGSEKKKTVSTSASSLTLPSTSEIKKIYDSRPGNFRQCQDIVYGKLWGVSPPNATGQGKAEIYQKMEAEGYWQADQGGMYDPQGLATRLGQLQDGDIIMFGRDSLPNESKANHYAIVSDGYIIEILNLKKGGEMNITSVKDAQKFFKPRIYTSKVNQKKYKTTAYYGYKIFRK